MTGKTILQRFKAGEQFDMIYHGERRRVTEMGYQRPGVIWAAAGRMLPVVMAENGVFKEGVIWLEPAKSEPAAAIAAPSQPEGADGKPWDTLTALEKAPKLVAELEAEAERITRYTNGPGDSLLNEAARVIEALSAGAAAPKRCEYCDDTGDVHSIDGEWRGRCSCAAGAAAPDEGSGWQPIETAPEGQILIVCGAGHEVQTAHKSQRGVARFWASNGAPIYPAYWMPLPSAPKGEEGQR